MNRLQWFLSIFLMTALFMGIWADNDSDSNDSGSGNDDNSNEADEKHHQLKYPAPPQQLPHPGYPYNQPVYMPQPPLPPFGGSYYPPPPMPYYYGYQPPPIPYGSPYLYGGYYNQLAPAPGQSPATATQGSQGYGGYYNHPVLTPGQAAPGHILALPTQGTHGYPGITGGSLKVNKEYLEDGRHYRPDGTLTN